VIVGADRLVCDFSNGDGLTLGPASRMSNAFSSWHLPGRYRLIATVLATNSIERDFKV
jgi:hypothetical protein